MIVDIVFYIPANRLERVVSLIFVIANNALNAGIGPLCNDTIGDRVARLKLGLRPIERQFNTTQDLIVFKLGVIPID